jgi:hypothetical protein
MGIEQRTVPRVRTSVFSHVQVNGGKHTLSGRLESASPPALPRAQPTQRPAKHAVRSTVERGEAVGQDEMDK